MQKSVQLKEIDMTAQEKFEKLTAYLNEGKNIYLQTHLKTTKITKKNLDNWAASGRPLLKVNGKSLYVARGKHYDCIDYCQITVANY